MTEVTNLLCDIYSDQRTANELESDDLVMALSLQSGWRKRRLVSTCDYRNAHMGSCLDLRECKQA